MLEAKWTGNNAEYGLQRGTGLAPDSLSHGEEHSRRIVTVGGQGPHCLGIRADLVRLWWKQNLKPEEDRLKPGGDGIVCGWRSWALKQDCLVGILTLLLSGCTTTGTLFNLSGLSVLVLGWG